eukprot:3786865-Rhodomonas_salina.1
MVMVMMMVMVMVMVMVMMTVMVINGGVELHPVSMQNIRSSEHNLQLTCLCCDSCIITGHLKHFMLEHPEAPTAAQHASTPDAENATSSSRLNAGYVICVVNIQRIHVGTLVIESGDVFQERGANSKAGHAHQADGRGGRGAGGGSSEGASGAYQPLVLLLSSLVFGLWFGICGAGPGY